MPKIIYDAWNPGADAKDIVHQANNICRDYAQQGYDLTLRQLFYQFVARGLIPNSQKSYKRLGDIINKARLAGLLDWNYITDRTRNLSSLGHWRSPGEIIHSAAEGFMLDHWVDQPVRVEVWVEKEALAGVVGQAADRYDCPWFSCRGYVSQSELWGAARRLSRHLTAGQRVVIVHLGDHDPSGIDMTRDITDRLMKFIFQDWLNARIDMGDGEFLTFGEIEKDVIHFLDSGDHSIDPGDNVGREPFEIKRIALNMDQVEQYAPPPNPAKITDSRAEKYIAEYGEESWELDALDPATLDGLISDTIRAELVPELYDAVVSSEDEQRQVLSDVSRRWEEVREFLNG